MLQKFLILLLLMILTISGVVQASGIKVLPFEGFELKLLKGINGEGKDEISEENCAGDVSEQSLDYRSHVDSLGAFFGLADANQL